MVVLCALTVLFAVPGYAFFEDLCLPRKGQKGPNAPLLSTGANPLPVRDYSALEMTVNELIEFGNKVALKHGWIANPELLPPDLKGGKSEQGLTAEELRVLLVGKVVSGKKYSRTEVYQSGIVTLSLQQTDTMSRLNAMNAALAKYGDTVRARSKDPAKFVAFQPMPGNSFTPGDSTVCWK